MRKFLQLVLTLICFLSFSQKIEKLALKKYLVAELPADLKETSGLDFFNDQLFSFNDSGNTSELFQIDKNSGQIINRFSTGLQNKDWEALTNDGHNFYIADFGNNGGSRKDLKIYKIPFHDGALNKDSVQTISYYYPNQTDFTFKNINTDFDAEAIVYANNRLHLFTKEWTSKGVSHYEIIPTEINHQPAQKVDFYKTEFVVTDAAYFQGKLYVVGYTKKLKVYLQIFEETKSSVFFKGKTKKFKLGNALNLGQIEGITVNEEGIYISGEQFNFPFKSISQRLYFVPHDIIIL